LILNVERKMANRKLLGMLGMVLALGLVFIGCGSVPQPVPIEGPNPFLGSWQYDGTGHATITFDADGSGTYVGKKFTYTVEGDTARIFQPGFIPSVVETTARLRGDYISWGGFEFKKLN